MMSKHSVLLTGASSGFGFLIARTLAEKGHLVYAGIREIRARNRKAANQHIDFSRTVPGEIRVVELDVTSEDSVSHAVKYILGGGDEIDVVINNAGIGSGGWQEGFTTAQFEKIFNVNVFGVQRVNKAVLPHYRKRGSGLLLHISSLAGRIVMPFMGPYAPSKFALEALAEAYHIEYGKLGIESVIVEPGGYGTEFGSHMLQTEDKKVIESYGDLADAPDKMWSGFVAQLTNENAPNPQEVADAVVSIIETPEGKRPLRTVVDSLMGGAGVDKINAQCAEAQDHLAESMH
ncbi:SDR family oxidoreductase [Fibrobacterota bacterium]